MHVIAQHYPCIIHTWTPPSSCDLRSLWRSYHGTVTVVFVSDSTVLAYVLKKLNEQYDYGLKLILLSVDEGITGYRDDSLEVHVKKQKKTYI